MNNKNIIIAGVIAVGLYLFSQTKKTTQRTRSTTTPTVRQRTAQKIAQKVAQKVAPKRIGQPTTQAARIAAARRAAARKAAIQRAAARKAAIRKAAARKAAIRKAAARKIGKKIGKTVAQKIPQNIRIRRALIALHAKKQRPRIHRLRPSKKQRASRLFSGAEKSRIIPYSESSRHSYYGPKSHKLFNEGYRVEFNKRLANSVEANHDRVVREVLSNPKLWNRWPERRHGI